MPIAVAIAIRYIIMAAVQLGLWWAVEKWGIPLLNKAIEELMVINGISRETATAIMANKVIRAFEEVGIFAATLKTKMPIKVAELLGFTSKGFAVRTISEVAGLAAEKTALTATTKAVATTAEVAKVAEVVSKSSGWGIKGVGDLLKYVTLVVGTPVGFFYAFAQYIDYAAWQNPYQKTFEGLLSYIGIHPDTAMPKAGAVSDDIWKRIYTTIEQLKPLGITFPFSDKDTPYSRANLADVTNEIAANLVKTGKQPTYKNVIAVLLASLQFGGKEPKVPVFPAGTVTSTSAPKSSTSKAVSTPTTKVFTGIVSQGVVGQGLVFEARPDDMIESVEELKQAAANNLAPFLQALLGKIVYEVKVVASVITKDGFKQTGTTQRIQTSVDKNGIAKYKTVTNKFATLIVYAITDKGTRAKLTTIILGPVDSAKLTVGQNDLQALQDTLPSLVTTSDINDITGIHSDVPVTVSTPSQTTQGSTPQAGSNAKTLSEWYQANGQALPVVSARAKIYQDLGLGQASFYTGTAEQNTSLLVKLKASVPTQVLPPAIDLYAGATQTPQGPVLHGSPYSLAFASVGGAMGQFNSDVQKIEIEMQSLGIDTTTDGIFTDAFLQKVYKIQNAQTTLGVRTLGNEGWMKLRDQYLGH